MGITKYLLIIILLLPQLAHSTYRAYIGNIGNTKVELYLYAISDDDFQIIYVDDKNHEITYLGLPERIDNDYYFKNYSIDLNDNKDSLILKNFDFSENQAKSQEDTLIGTSLKFGDFKLKKFLNII